MGKVAISNYSLSHYRPTIGIDAGVGPSYSAIYQSECAVQNEFEKEVKNIRWLWPYRLRPEATWSQNSNYVVTINGTKYPGAIVSGISDKYPKLLFIIPIEYRLATNAELSGLYPSLAGWNEFLREKVIFYEEYFSDGTRKTGFTKPYAFFSKYELEEEK